MYNGIINVYKEKGYTSHDVVAKLRRILKQKKIGHTGTLDPEATGVLPVCLGCGTKLCDTLTDKNKAYRARLLFGIKTDTQDTTGRIIEKDDNKQITIEEFEYTIKTFIGDYNQIPPMYSAIKINGKKLYELARQGKEVKREPRRVQIMSITIEEYNYPYATIVVECSKGTYIRTLCQDIGERLNTCACMDGLERIRVGQFTLDNSINLLKIEDLCNKGQIDSYIMQVDEALDNYRAVCVKEDYNKLLINGNKLEIEYIDATTDKEPVAGEKTFSDKEMFRVYDSYQRFIALYEYDEKYNYFVPVKYFGLEESAVTVGKFDGLHEGHNLLINNILKTKLNSVVITFTKNPADVIQGNDTVSLLTNLEKREYLLSKGVNEVCELNIMEDILKMEPEQFIKEILVIKYNTKYFTCGEDFHFGHNKAGDISLLKEYSYKYGFKLEVVEKLKIVNNQSLENEVISSSIIKERLKEGQVEAANEMLGYRYSVIGKVTHGRRIGNKMGYPTINIIPDKDKFLPVYGVYETRVEIDKCTYKAVTNVGLRPTFTDDKKIPIVETFIIDYDGDLYDRVLRVQFVRFIRRETRFNSLEELKLQLKNDTKSVILSQII